VSATGLRKGALPRPHNLVLPKLEDYVSKDLLATAPMPPANGNVDRQSKVTNGWPMYMNGPDPNAPEVIQQAGGIGDCTCAGMGHAVSQWTAYSGKVAGGAEFTDATILTMYEAVSGYVLGNESTDNGAALYQVCNYMMNTGIKDTKGNLHKIEGYADISLFNNIGWIKGVLNCRDCGVAAFRGYERRALRYRPLRRDVPEQLHGRWRGSHSDVHLLGR
jgi:hypothetical protein